MNTSSFNMMNNLYVPADRDTENDFERQYIALRLKEQRVYTDEELFHLPDITANHAHFNEWLMRRKSSSRLIQFLESKRKILSILEVGCGNGWLAYQMSRMPGSRVIGLDINLAELLQGARVFNSNSKLKFIYGDIRSGIVSDLKFDIIVFAASLQYFSGLKEILGLSLAHLYPDGEIHIIDSPFYKPKTVEAAINRTKSYYDQLGFPGMVQYYHHHCITDLQPYRFKILRNPFSIKNKLSGNNNPFPWICIKNK